MPVPPTPAPVTPAPTPNRHDETDMPEQDVTVPPTVSPSADPTAPSMSGDGTAAPVDPSMAPTESSAAPSKGPSVTPATPLPSSIPSNQPSDEVTSGNSNPTMAPNDSGAGDEFRCEDYPDTNFFRICKDGGCCDPVRSSTDHCHREYSFFGDDMAKVCSDCCATPKQLAPPPPVHPVYPPIDCALIDNPFRICKPTSCCNAERTDNSYCNDVYDAYPGDLMGSVCWYCCSEPKEVGPELRRNRQLRGKTQDAVMELPDGRRSGLPLKMDDVNFIEAEDLEKEYLDGIEDYRRRQEEQLLVPPMLENYEQVHYLPYNWMREVKTEYYYRYEGSQAVPPCYEKVHWRVMKDPIRVHPDQIRELERLLAERIAPKGSEFNECERDTAGRERPGTDGKVFDFNRPLQSNSRWQVQTFCHCSDWTSKFPEDRAWCELDRDDRFYDYPYNFNVPEV